MRKFDTGAIRDKDEGKLAYAGFLNPMVLRRFAEFMHEKRHLPDGSLRGPDNWQKGIPKESYVDSLLRHTWDIWLHSTGYSKFAEEDLETALCATMFNAMGLLKELIQERTGVAPTLLYQSGESGTAGATGADQSTESTGTTPRYEPAPVRGVGIVIVETSMMQARNRLIGQYGPEVSERYRLDEVREILNSSFKYYFYKLRDEVT